MILEDAQVDSLTGFYLRGELNPLLKRMITDAEAGAKGFSVAIIDLDHLKKFNDRYGHLFGDEILRYTTSTLRLTIYEAQCTFFRYGGDEFIGVFPEQDPKAVLQLIRQCHYNLGHRPFLFENKFYRITISGGISGYPADGKTAEELIQKADEALYFSKRSGRNQSVVVGRIQYLRLRRIITFTGLVCFIIIAMGVAYRYAYKKLIQSPVSRFRGFKIVTKPRNLDKVVLKNGLTFDGRILTEARGYVVMNLYFKRGEGQMTFDKSEIAAIEHAPKPHQE